MINEPVSELLPGDPGVKRRDQR